MEDTNRITDTILWITESRLWTMENGSQITGNGEQNTGSENEAQITETTTSTLNIQYNITETEQ